MSAKELESLQEIAREAWPKPLLGGEDPPTPEHLVRCLTNVAVNRLARIRELERHIANLCNLNQRQ